MEANEPISFRTQSAAEKSTPSETAVYLIDCPGKRPIKENLQVSVFADLQEFAEV